jgi:hypothetical protein
MDIGSIFLILALFLLVGVFISRPFIERNVRLVGEENRTRSALLAERDRILNALQELDFDHALGKIPEPDYPVQRASLLQRGAQVLREIDTLEGETQSRDDTGGRLEAVIEARRAEVSGEFVASQGARADDDIETLIAARRRVRQGKAAGFCPKCGGPIRKTDQFCSRCGATLG